ncbi:MAG: rhomboid family intramembrane serine protease [Planctomycetota bacterium]
MSRGLLEQADRTPATYIILVAYITMAVLTDPFSPTGSKLLEYGAAQSMLIQDGEAWRLLSYAFLHGGILHLIFNTYCLIQFGPLLEERLKTAKFLLLYVFASLGGSITAVAYNNSNLIMVGGSGALFGMFGAALAINMRQGRHHLEFLDYYGPRSIPMLIGINLLIGWLIPFISNTAHIGGLVAGFALTFCLLDRGRSPHDRISRSIAAGWLALVLSLTLYCVNPVLRWDHRLREYWQTEDPARQQELADLLADDPWAQEMLSILRNPALQSQVPAWLLKRVKSWRE